MILARTGPQLARILTTQHDHHGDHSRNGFSFRDPQGRAERRGEPMFNTPPAAGYHVWTG
jgi:hypothetical protein